MKYLTILLMLFSVVATAKDFTVTRDGKSKTYSDDEYVVVKKRKKSAKPAAPKAPPQAEAPPAKVVEVVREEKKNMISLYGGFGPEVYNTEITGTSMHISQGYEAVLGLGYTRKVTDRCSAHIIGLTNGTGLLGAGVSF